MTNLDDILKRMEDERREAESKAEQKAKEVMDKLTLAGAKCIYIGFDGSGDEGSIHTVDGLNENEHITEEDLENWAYELIAGTGVDWYNDTGGFGTINIDVPKRTYNFEVNYRIETSELAASGEIAV